MATLKVTCTPAVHTNGTHHTVALNPPNGPAPQIADANGCTTFLNLTTGQYNVVVCGGTGKQVNVSGFTNCNAPSDSKRGEEDGRVGLVFAIFAFDKVDGHWPAEKKWYAKLELATDPNVVTAVSVICEGDAQFSVPPGKYFAYVGKGNSWHQFKNPKTPDGSWLIDVGTPDEPWVSGPWNQVKAPAAKKPAAKKPAAKK